MGNGDIAYAIKDAARDVASEMRISFVSGTCCDRNGEQANIVDGLYEVASAIRCLAEAVKD